MPFSPLITCYTAILDSLYWQSREAIADPRMKKMRQLDKLVDELAKGWPVEKVIFAGLDSPRLL
jgi:hypothetical protein